MAFDGTLKFDTAIDQSGFKSGLSGLGNFAKAGMTAVTGAVTAATGAVAGIGKKALDAYADFEQLAGGVETLFGEAAQTVMDNASRAFETAGMSANAYMETATASAAAMVNSLGGDVQRAAELTDMAVTDMADNINKMGTAAENVQNAYAGFAKGNFTMLDNLKLGYGGTKAEMERLLAAAQELSGVEYSIDSYADIVQAIHVVQESMGITGTTAREASETISGSVAAMKAAWDNLLVGIADDTQDFDKLTDEFLSAVETAAGNILPRVETIGGGLVKLVGSLGDDVVELLTDALGYAPEFIGIGAELLEKLADGLYSSLPDLLDSGEQIIATLLQSISTTLPKLSTVGAQILAMLGKTILDNLPMLLETAVTLVQGFVEMLSDPETLNALLDAGLAILEMLMQVIGDNIDPLISAAILIVETLGVYLAEHAPEIVTAALELVLAIVDAILDNIDPLLDAAIAIITALAEALTDPEKMQPMLEAAGELIAALFDVLMDVLTMDDKAGEFTEKLASSIGDKLAEVDWAELGKAILDGIFSGLLGVDFDFYEYLDDFKENWVSGIKDIFGIHSPSKLMRDTVGKNLALGIGEGFAEEIPDVGQDALHAFRDMQREIDPGALEALRTSLPGLDADRYAQPPASLSYITNHYSSTSYTTNGTDDPSDPAAPGGDIIIPVSIGGQQIDTIVVKAAQIANARSGGVTI